MSDAFNAQLEQVERAIKIINTIENNPDLQNKTFDLLFGAAPGTPATPRRTQPKEKPEQDGADDGNGSKGRSSGKRSSKPGAVTIVRDLDTDPEGGTSWKAFIENKKPTSQNDRNIAAVFWAKEFGGREKVNADVVFTLYVDAGWKPPTNPKNSLQITASKKYGFLDTANMEDITVTPRGIGRIKNDLPGTEK